MICLDAIELTWGRHFARSLSSAESSDTERPDVGGSTSMHLSVVFAWDEAGKALVSASCRPVL
jgi:hypothetical protein